MTQATDTEIRDLILGLDKKLDVYIAQSTEQFKNIETRLSDFKESTDTQLSDLKTQLSETRTQLRSQDTRLWGFIVTLSLAVIGFLSKLAFFPQA
jgi:flagellar capping protein FliD